MSIQISKKNRFPSTTLKASSLVRVAKTVGIDRHAIEHDVEVLLYHFISTPKQSFKDFDDLWNQVKFGHIHFACLKREFRANYMNAFFKSFLDHFSSKLMPIRCAVIFSLYFMYMSQPAIWGKNRIRVTADIYESLFKFYHESIMSEINIEAAMTFDKLRHMEAFVFVAEEEQDSSSVQEKKEFEKAINMRNTLYDLKKQLIDENPIQLCSSSSMTEYESLANEYQVSKTHTFYTPQASLAIQKQLKETLNVTEQRPRLLQNVLLTSTLAQDETVTLKRITKASQQFLNSKRRKLSVKRTVS